MEICVQKTVDARHTTKNGFPVEHSRDNATKALDSRISLLDIRDATNHSIKTTMSQQSETSNEIGKDRTEITVELVDETDIPEVLALLKEFFIGDEPMNVCLGIGNDCEELKQYCIKSIPDKCSYKAVDSNGKIVGVFLNGINKKPASCDSPVSYADACQHEKFRTILKLFEYIDTQFNVFDMYPNIDKFMDGKILAVDKKCRGYGIAGMLTNRTIEYMRANNIPLYLVMCSSHYSARVCEKLSFQKVYTLNFVDYVVDGENPILPAEPHKSVQIYVLEVK